MSLTDAVSKAGMMPDVTVPEKGSFIMPIALFGMEKFIFWIIMKILLWRIHLFSVLVKGMLNYGIL